MLVLSEDVEEAGQRRLEPHRATARTAGGNRPAGDRSNQPGAKNPPQLTPQVVAVHESRATSVQQQTRCGSMISDPVDVGSEASSKGTSIRPEEPLFSRSHVPARNQN